METIHVCCESSTRLKSEKRTILELLLTEPLCSTIIRYLDCEENHSNLAKVNKKFRILILNIVNPIYMLGYLTKSFYNMDSIFPIFTRISNRSPLVYPSRHFANMNAEKDFIHSHLIKKYPSIKYYFVYKHSSTGWGLHTSETIGRNTPLFPYAGEVIHSKKLQLRKKDLNRDRKVELIEEMMSSQISPINKYHISSLNNRIYSLNNKISNFSLIRNILFSLELYFNNQRAHTNDKFIPCCNFKNQY
jgi:hypothetical protein